MEELLSKVKANLILEHSVDDELLKGYITAAVTSPPLSPMRKATSISRKVTIQTMRCQPLPNRR